MITKIEENTDIRTIQTLIDEANALGMKVIHRPETLAILRHEQMSRKLREMGM